MQDLLLVLAMIFTAAIASGVLVPLLVGRPKGAVDRERRDAELRDELAALS